MKLTKDNIKQIVLEETQKYLEEIRALDPELYKQVIQSIRAGGKKAYARGHVPFTEPHRARARDALLPEHAAEVMIMVYGDPKGVVCPGCAPLKDWPTDPADREIVKEFLTQLHNYPEDEVLDQEGNPLIPWSAVQREAMMEMEKYKQRTQLEEIIKEEVIKYLKENE